MLFRCPSLGEKEERIRAAIGHLNRATQIDDTNGQSWYYLGRCYSALRDVNSAFNNYRKSIDKSEACADTWCSIGVLYQEQKQFMDALQAFICAVQLDPNHQEAWKDLGVLYEAKGQYHDAFVCYRRSINCKPVAGIDTSASGNSAKEPNDEQLLHRSKILQDSEPPIINQSKLPSIEEAWTLPIPAELTQRQTARRADRRNIHAELLKYKQHAENESKKVDEEVKPDLLLSNEESVVLRHLQQSSHSLTPPQQSELERLQFGLFTVDYLKKNGKNTRNAEEAKNEPMETDQF
jgi:histone demethylase